MTRPLVQAVGFGTSVKPGSTHGKSASQIELIVSRANALMQFPVRHRAVLRVCLSAIQHDRQYKKTAPLRAQFTYD